MSNTNTQSKNNGKAVGEIIGFSFLGILLIIGLVSFFAKDTYTYRTMGRHLPAHRHITPRFHFHATATPKTKRVKTKRPLPRPVIVRAIILENSTVTYCTLSTFQLSYLRPLDTVWVNLYTHSIDDNSPNTMKAVLYTCNQKF
jgi:hypothetical protein